jgi:hypothetical protein
MFLPIPESPRVALDTLVKEEFRLPLGEPAKVSFEGGDCYADHFILHMKRICQGDRRKFSPPTETERCKKCCVRGAREVKLKQGGTAE